MLFLGDVLNIAPPPGYSSALSVLIEYSEADARPAMAVFKVLREKPEASILFDFIVKAGSVV